jgi:tetratricopeptide (TPR) repeat protein
VDVASNRTLWRDQVQVAASDSLAMRDQITSAVRQGLVPALGVTSSAGGAGTRPKNEEAYDLYLRSVAFSRDAAPNKQGISMLERVVSIDPTYAPAWEALGLRYYFDAQYGGGGEAMFNRSNAAYERALVLDPNLIDAASQIIANRTERGDLVNSYAEALALVNRFPESTQAHFTLSYVLRYAGLLNDSARECETAFALDPGNDRLRSCAWPYVWLGQPDKATKFLQTDRGSEWVARVMPYVFLAQGKRTEAQESVNHMPAGVAFGRDFLQACLVPGHAGELESATKEFVAAIMLEPDSERRYANGTLLAYCGQQDAGRHAIASAIQRNYCSYSNLQHDPLLANLRNKPEFAQLLSAAKACQDDFLSKRAKPAP